MTTTSSAKATDPAAIDVNDVDDKDKDADKKKKKVKPVLQVPPEVVTAYLIVRAAVWGVLGIANHQQSDSDGNTQNQVKISALQKTFLKQAGTGKFSVSLGKKVGNECALVALPETVQDEDALWTAIDEAIGEILSRKDEICILHLSPEKALELSARISDGNLPPVKKPASSSSSTSTSATSTATTLIPFAYYAKGHVLAPCPDATSRPYATFSAASSVGDIANTNAIISSITLDRKQCSVAAGKKVREAKLTVAFQCKLNNTEGSSSTITTAKLAEPWNDNTDVVWMPPPESTVLSEEMMAGLDQAIRFSQGEALLLRQVEKAAAEAAEAAAAAEQLDEAALVSASSAEQEQVVEKEKAVVVKDNDDDEMVVNVEEVKGKIDYDKLVQQFGSTLITPDLLGQLQSLSALPLHRFLRRGTFFSHRDLDILLAALAKNPKKALYLYTGRGPSSSSMHLGHLIPFLFTKWLQDALGAPLVIQMTDDEKFLFKGVYDDVKGDNLSDFQSLTMENAKDIIACGFDYEKTFLFSDLDYVGAMYPNIVRIWKAVTTNTVNGIFGFDGSSNIGKVAFPAIQAAPSFASSFPTVLGLEHNSETTASLSASSANDWLCLIPCAIDQDPYFRMTRDVAHKLVPDHRTHGLGGKPALIHSKFFPPLQGAMGKMSSSDENSAVFLTDSPAQIADKIKNHAFSGGQATKAEQQEFGADLSVDVAYQWLTFFLEDDADLEKIGQDYSSGSGEYWSTHLVKQKLVQVLQDLVGEHQTRRAAITDDDVRKWMKERSIV